MPATAAIGRPGWSIAARCIVGSVVFVGLYLTSRYSYDLFHGLAELFSVVVAAAVFVIAWNARRYFVNNYVLLSRHRPALCGRDGMCSTRSPIRD